MPEVHTELEREHLTGNAGRGRLVFLPGSAGRAKEIYAHFDVQEEVHPARRVELTSYFGRLRAGPLEVEVCALATGMGGPALNIVLGELLHLGAREFIRVGTAGSLREEIKVGDIVIVREAYKDEHTSLNYLPREWPARAHPHLVEAAVRAAKRLGYGPRVHLVTGHSKDDLWEEDFPEPYRRLRNPYRRERVERLMAEVRRHCQSTAMEEAVLYIVTEEAGLAELVQEGFFRWEELLEKRGEDWLVHPPEGEAYWRRMRYKALAIDAILGGAGEFPSSQKMREVEEAAIRLALETARELYQDQAGL
jgi:uridine phosphorylase